ncbi:MAG: YegS/Rv2252/BmrU family lipid kinase, partial [Myxococcales bacterium]|nr:YegS/Rv2252/BmrU family lipid kinase [Myxococcales bacterium]
MKPTHEDRGAAPQSQPTLAPTPRTRLVLNGGAGDDAGQAAVADAARRLPWVDIVRPADIEAFQDAVKGARAEGYDVVAVAGGDGSVRAATAAVASLDQGPALAVIPCGTANDFARSLHLPADPVEALRAIAGGRLRPVDAARIVTAEGETIFVNAATGGATDAIEARLTPEMKRRWGRLAYARAALEALPTMSGAGVTVEVDGRVYAGAATGLVVANGRWAGGQQVAPPARPDDHLLDVVVVTAETLGERASVLFDFVEGRHCESDNV